MTTIAFDGRFLAADRLATDNWGLKEEVSKIILGTGWVAGVAGATDQQIRWTRAVENKSFEEALLIGYPDYKKTDDDPAILIVSTLGEVFKHTCGVFAPCVRDKMAIGSGRDYALAAMYCGKTAKGSIHVASQFDVYTGYDVDQVEVVKVRRKK